jgi:hypothetical protein
MSDYTYNLGVLDTLAINHLSSFAAAVLTP